MTNPITIPANQSRVGDMIIVARADLRGYYGSVRVMRRAGLETVYSPTGKRIHCEHFDSTNLGDARWRTDKLADYARAMLATVVRAAEQEG